FQFRVEVLETCAVGAPCEWIGARLDRPQFKTAKPLQRIQGPTGRLAELAVADDIDPRLSLLTHHLPDRILQAALISLLGRSCAVLPPAHQIEKACWTDQTSGMGGQNSAVTALHCARLGGLLNYISETNVCGCFSASTTSLRNTAA